MSDLTSPFTGKRLATVHAQQLADVMKALGEPARLQLLNILYGGGEWSGYELVTKLGRLSQPTVHHHLAILVDAGLVTARKDGRYVMHTLDRSRLAEISALIRPPRAWKDDR
jgi:ArsR family transcriptional regulator